MTGGPDVQAAMCATLVDEWARAGVTDAVVAPGSRSTPMLAALAADGRLALHVVLDERAAGFVALGLGLATGRPALVVTTSGTAAVELHPAVVEAGQAGVPLLAVTADRPPELHHVGAPQTVEQDGLYGPAVRWAVSPGVADLESSSAWRPLAARAVAVACDGPGGPGPVHLNLAFREPLLGDPAVVAVPPGRAGGRPWHDRPLPSSGGPTGAARAGIAAAPAARLAGEAAARLAALARRRGVLVVGAGAGDPALVLGAARRLGWPILADLRSGCRWPDPAVVAAADALLRVPDVAAWAPEVVVRLGQPWASKVLGQWLAGLDPAVPQVLVDPTGRWADPERRVSDVLAAEPAAVLAALLGGLDAEAGEADGVAAGGGAAGAAPRGGGAGGGGAAGGGAIGAAGLGAVPAVRPRPWVDQWAAAEVAAQAAIDVALAAEGGLSEPLVARTLVAALPDGATLVTSASMPLRDVEWYGAPRRALRVLANRGANGIDGVLATAVGVALARGGPTVALLGDLAFLYDAGALLWAREGDLALTVVVVDNDGGGIFSFLPQAAAFPPAQFERYWGTPHNVDLTALARAYGASVVPITCQEELEALCSRAADPGVRVAIVPSERARNVAVHERVHVAVAEAVAEAVAAPRR